VPVTIFASEDWANESTIFAHCVEIALPIQLPSKLADLGLFP
jgi:hypothetical protein